MLTETGFESVEGLGSLEESTVEEDEEMVEASMATLTIACWGLW
jgi:hypothetical protein